MATRTETLRAHRAPRSVWILLFAIVVVAAALAIGALVRSEGESAGPAPRVAETQVEPATHVPGLVKAGLQPRPFSPIEVGGTGTEKTPDGFVRMRGGELRPTQGR